MTPLIPILATVTALAAPAVADTDRAALLALHGTFRFRIGGAHA